ncbi:MAG: amidoligase family protein [Candidatus Limiplasma sp.]|nr:amidoligase family protein [Candidatus Limiplasma sp.]
MKDQTFGIEIRMTHITRIKAVEVIAAHFGTYPEWVGGIYATRCATDEQGCDWKIMSSGVFAGPDDEETTKLVSPICRWEDIGTVQALIRKLWAAGARPDPNCAIHIHLGKGNHPLKALRNLRKYINAAWKQASQSTAFQSNPPDNALRYKPKRKRRVARAKSFQIKKEVHP